MSLDHLLDLPWADSDPMSNESIDVIIGAVLYGELILEGLCRGKPGQPIAQRSELGWVISGPLDQVESSVKALPQDTSERPGSRYSSNHITVHHSLTASSLEQNIRNFWETEEVPTVKFLNPADEQCEQHFWATHSRNHEGRYVVRVCHSSRNLQLTSFTLDNAPRNVLRVYSLNYLRMQSTIESTPNSSRNTRNSGTCDLLPRRATSSPRSIFRIIP